MSVLLFFFVACSSGPTAQQADVASKSRVSNETTPAPKPANPETAKALDKPAGSIGGVPILPKPIVLGAIDPKKVDDAIAQLLVIATTKLRKKLEPKKPASLLARCWSSFPLTKAGL